MSQNVCQWSTNQNHLCFAMQAVLHNVSGMLDWGLRLLCNVGTNQCQLCQTVGSDCLRVTVNSCAPLVECFWAWMCLCAVGCLCVFGSFNPEYLVSLRFTPLPSVTVFSWLTAAEAICCQRAELTRFTTKLNLVCVWQRSKVMKILSD